MRCDECKGFGLVQDFDCYHGRPDWSPVQCSKCKGTGKVNPEPKTKTKREYLNIADKILGK